MTKSRDLANAATALNAVTAAELGYVDGVTSAIQTQLDAKLASSTAATTYVANALADAKGDIFVASADNTVTRLPVGSTGDTIVADSSTSTGLRYQGSTAAGRNFAVNGGFDIWQRGTTFSTNGSYTADRWYFTYGGTVTAAQETTVVQDGSTNSIKLTTGAATSFGELYNALEAAEVNFLAGKTITISGSVRASSAVAYTGSAVIGIQTNTTANTQTGGTWTEQSTSTQAPSTSAWTRFSLTYTVPSGTKGLRVRLGNTATQASGTILYWSNIQIEVGSVATGFSRAGGSIQGELAACQRYFQKSYNTDVAPGTGSAAGPIYASQVASTTSSGQLAMSVAFNTTMRGTATIVVYDLVGGVNVCNRETVGLGGDTGQSANVTQQGAKSFILYGTGTNRAGLACHYTASAEL